jgi:uncharacterized GH25 family protein
MAWGLVLGVGSAASALAHEFWLLPEDFTVEPGAQMVVELRNGEKMNGINLPYLPGSVTRFEVVAGDTVLPVISRLGDSPAMTMKAPAEGLIVVVHQTAGSTVIYSEFAAFQSFVTHKAAAGALEAHSARGLPDKGFSETYRRYAKTLIAVGDSAGQDRDMGLRIEIVALANPYTDDLTAGLPLQVRLDGAPRAGAQLEVFAKAPDGTVTEALYTTDAAGVAMVPAVRGFTYLADNVDIYALPNDDAAAGPVWHSDWASLTYMVP